jgi:hypothetical protein
MTQRPGAHLAKAAQARAAYEVQLLRPGKVEEAQGDLPGPVSQANEQAAPAPEGDFRQGNLPFDHHPLTRPERAERRNPRAVLVALGKQEQQVERPLNAQP